ncbi:hypothetical protein [Acinetobacter radioresistens]|uniref:hypothetical protein n=1 Tax=Acinetobacter radioresistens TaxID=40216 RepID=UPI002246DE63|nr:hypothetical protein [Acinetobacter radioresistens]MCX0335039.1 hypothetical protein [Acinetobacter radioresistens]
MNTAVEKQHILQTMDWSRFDLEGWLYQFGAWMNSQYSEPRNEMIKTLKSKKLGKLKREQLIGRYMADLEYMETPRKAKTVCSINDNEARAVQRLILDMQGQSEVLDEWLDAIIDRYFYGNSWRNMVIKVGRVDNPTILRSEMDARSDVKCGLAALHSRYNFIPYK